MVFQALAESLERGELLLWQGGMCRFHLCTRGKKRGQITVHEILVAPGFRRSGVGRRMLEALAATPDATHIIAKCAVSYDSNQFWARCGFANVRTEYPAKGQAVNVWRKNLPAISSASETTSGRCGLPVLSAGKPAAAPTALFIPVDAR